MDPYAHLVVMLKNSMDDGLVTDEFPSDTFGIDTQVNYNYNKLI